MSDNLGNGLNCPKFDRPQKQHYCKSTKLTKSTKFPKPIKLTKSTKFQKLITLPKSIKSTKWTKLNYKNRYIT